MKADGFADLFFDDTARAGDSFAQPTAAAAPPPKGLGEVELVGSFGDQTAGLGAA